MVNKVLINNKEEFVITKSPGVIAPGFLLM